jgi:hypothetical protein
MSTHPIEDGNKRTRQAGGRPASLLDRLEEVIGDVLRDLTANIRAMLRRMPPMEPRPNARVINLGEQHIQILIGALCRHELRR